MSSFFLLLHETLRPVGLAAFFFEEMFPVGVAKTAADTGAAQQLHFMENAIQHSSIRMDTQHQLIFLWLFSRHVLSLGCLHRAPWYLPVLIYCP